MMPLYVLFPNINEFMIRENIKIGFKCSFEILFDLFDFMYWLAPPFKYQE